MNSVLFIWDEFKYCNLRVNSTHGMVFDGVYLIGWVVIIIVSASL